MFRIIYLVKNRKNLRSEEDVFADTLANAVDSYQPDAILYIDINGSKIELDVGRDIYRFHRNLINITESLAFDLPGKGPYRDIFGSLQPEQKVYSMVLTEPYNPQILYFLAEKNNVYLQTRTLQKDKVVVSPEDIVTPVLCSRRQVIDESCSFLRNYMKDLIHEIPEAANLDDYKTYIERLDKIQIQASAWS